LIGSSRLHTASTAKRYVYNLKSTLSHPIRCSGGLSVSFRRGFGPGFLLFCLVNFFCVSPLAPGVTQGKDQPRAPAQRSRPGLTHLGGRQRRQCTTLSHTWRVSPSIRRCSGGLSVSFRRGFGPGFLLFRAPAQRSRPGLTHLGGRQRRQCTKTWPTPPRRVDGVGVFSLFLSGPWRPFCRFCF
jgi:hypothetical protein